MNRDTDSGRFSLRAAALSEADPIAPLWRAAQVFRIVTLVYAISYQIGSVGNYTNQRLSWVFVALMAVWTGASALFLSRGATLRWPVVVADQLVVAGLMVATRFVADPDWMATHQTLPTTLWATNAVLSAAFLRGPIAGVVSAVGISAVSAVVRDQVNSDLWRDATAPVLISVGLALGLAANTAIRAHEHVERAIRLAAATEERERLAREVHDGVLQVLAYVARRGAEIGGPATELAEKAGEQEVALRVLISEQGAGAESDSGGHTVDLRPMLKTQARPSVSVSTPGEPVLVGRWVGRELAAAVATALSNVELHAGRGAKAYVLLEDLGDDVVVSVRDDGAGIPAGRLVEAEAEGRMGVAKSIRGRVDALGGTVSLLTDPGEGTEWEFRVPRGGGEL